MSIIERAEAELKAINFGKGDSMAMIEILRLFFKQWDSGGGVFVAAPVLQRLIAGKPLTPLTGADDEWIDRTVENSGVPMWQNIRCSSVMKRDGKAFDADAGPGIVEVTFPYWPKNAEVGDPVVEF